MTLNGFSAGSWLAGKTTSGGQSAGVEQGATSMSAGFCVDDEVFWGTNGSVQAYVEALTTQAAARFGAADPFVVFLREELEGFFPGKVVFLDAWLGDDARRKQFVEILDAATNQLLGEGGFTEYGLEWVQSVVVAQFRARLARIKPTESSDR